MTKPRGLPRRLDELAAVTAEYAKYSRTRFGLGDVGFGAWWLAAAAFPWLLPSVGQAFVKLAPIVWLAALHAARARYQRRGEVVEPEENGYSLFTPTGRRRWALVWIYVVSVLGIVQANVSGPGAHLLDAAVFIALPAPALHVTRGAVDSLVTACIASFTVAVQGDGRSWATWELTGLGIVSGSVGLWQHVRYLALERRFAALRSPAP